MDFLILNRSTIDSLTELYRDSKYLVLDYESSSLNSTYHDFIIGGIGLMNDKGVKVYIDLKSLETEFIKSDYSPLINLFTNPNIVKVVFNANFEYTSTKNFFNCELINYTDVLMQARMFAEGGSLKSIAMKKFKIDNWSDGVRDYVDSCNNIIQNLRPTPKGSPRFEYDQLLITMNDNGSIINYMDRLREYYQSKLIQVYFKKFNSYVLSSKLSSELIFSASKFTITGYFDNLRTNYKEVYEKLCNLASGVGGDKVTTTMMQDLFTTSEELYSQVFDQKNYADVLTSRELVLYDSLSTLISTIKSCDNFLLLDNLLIKLIHNKVLDKFNSVNYTEVPLQLLSNYCIKDIEFTDKLYNYYQRLIIEKSLHTADEVYQNQSKLSAEMEWNGIAWSQTDYLELLDQYSRDIFNHAKSLLLGDNPNRVLPTLLQIRWGIDTNNHQVFLYQSALLKLKSACYTGVSSYSAITTDSDFINPSSTHITTRTYLSKLIITKRVIPFLAIREYSNIINDINYQPNNYPNLSKLYKFTQLYKYSSTTVINYMNQVHTTFRSVKFTKYEEDICNKYSDDYIIDSLDTTNLRMIYEVFTSFIKIDVEDNTTWLDEFWDFYHFRRYKKVLKVLSTVLLGEVGFNQVSYIDYNTHIRSSECKNTYSSFIYNSSFIPCAALTKRWFSRVHTFPSKCHLLDLRTTRFSEGLRVVFDYSQMEIRVLAALSGDEKLIEVLTSGKDIHKYVASVIYRKPIETVTTTERTIAKTAVFSILYGKSRKGFAMTYLYGDIKKANELFDEFFLGFPKIDLFIKNKHWEGLSTGYVSNLFGDPLNVEMPSIVSKLTDQQKYDLMSNLWTDKIKFSSDRQYDSKIRMDIGKALRNSQNYPIQSSASNMTGHILYLIYSEMKKLGMRGLIDCFTHDSGNFDIPINELPQLIHLIKTLSLDIPKNQWNVPADIDIEIGRTGFRVVKLSQFDEVSKGTYKVKASGVDRACTDVINQLSKVYKVRDFHELSSKTEYVSMSDAVYYGGVNADAGTNLTEKVVEFILES